MNYTKIFSKIDAQQGEVFCNRLDEMPEDLADPIELNGSKTFVVAKGSESGKHILTAKDSKDLKIYTCRKGGYILDARGQEIILVHEAIGKPHAPIPLFDSIRHIGPCLEQDHFENAAKPVED